MKFYVGDEVEVTIYGDRYYGTVSGFYEDGLPRLVNSSGHVIPKFSDWHYSDKSEWAITKPGVERVKTEKFFNDRSFIDRLCYLFTGKMP